MSDCNCIDHFCAGMEAEKSLKGRPVNRLSHNEVIDIAASRTGTKFEGSYAVSIYHRPSVRVFNSQRTWMLALEILTELCGVNVTRLTFEADDGVKTYEYGLVED